MTKSDLVFEQLNSYPDTLSKEQLYKVCHISKKTAQFLLEHGIIPSISSGKKTRKYTIKKSDVIDFLYLRDKNPDIAKVAKGWYGQSKKEHHVGLNQAMTDMLKAAYWAEVHQYPDLLSVRDIHKITGYHEHTINHWCAEHDVHCYLIRGKYLIPKESFIKFVQGTKYRSIRLKSDKHKFIIDQILHQLSL